MFANQPTGTDVDFSYASADQPVLSRTFVRTFEKLTGQQKLRKLYLSHAENHQASGSEDEDFFADAIRLLNLRIELRTCAPHAPPTSGPVIFIANHPYGVLDGIVFTWIVRQFRPEAKIMANSVLCRAPEARPHLLPVDFGTTKQALQTNLETRRSALNILLEGGAIGLFPAGGVAASRKPLSGPALDPQWSPFLAKLVQKSSATVVPLFFAGQNSRLFQIASHFSYPLRLALFFRETRRLMNSRIQVAMGEPLTPENLALFTDKDDLIAHLRQTTFSLAQKLDLPARLTPDHADFFSYPARFKFKLEKTPGRRAAA